MSRSALTIQTWLVWGFAVSLPVMLGRNPFVLALVSLVIAAVAIVHTGDSGEGVPPGFLVRMVVLIGIFTVFFNLLTARTGNQVIVDLPDSWWVLSGPLTWNAVVFGLLSAWALICLVAIWLTVGSNVRWASLARILPERLTGFAVAGSTAINLIPQTTQAYIEIREASAVRGFALDGPRGVASMITPVINGGIDRSMRMAEVLESRGFGSRSHAERSSTWREQAAWVAMLGGGFMAVYGLSAGIAWAGLAGLAGFAAGVLVLRQNDPNAIRRTRFREQPLRMADWIVITTCAAAIVLIAAASSLFEATYRYEPYPDIVVPEGTVVALLPILLLAVPAMFAPGPRT